MVEGGRCFSAAPQFLKVEKVSDLWTEKYKFQHRLQGVVNASGEEIAEVLEGALEKVTGKIIALEARAEDSKSYAFRKRYLDAQKAEIQKVLAEIYTEIGEGIKAKALETALAMPAMTQAMVKNGGISIRLGMPRLKKSTVQAWFDSSQVEGLYFNEWLKKLEANAVSRIIKETREASILLEGTAQTAKRIQTALDVGRKSAEGLAHNFLAQAANWGERELWTHNPESLRGLRFVAEIDRQTTPLCISLDQKVFAVEDCPQPPLHWRCRSMIFPVFKWEKEDDRLDRRIARIDTGGRTVHHRDGTTSTKFENLRVKFIPGKFTHSDWMQSMVHSKDPRDVAFAREALGPKRFELVKSGKLTVDRLYYGGKLRTIKELEALTQ